MLHAIGDRLARWQADGGFRDLAAAFPLTRPVARRRAASLFDLCAGFVHSQVLLAIVELGVPGRLLAGPRTAADLAPEMDMPEPALERLFAAAASVRLLAARGPDEAGRLRYGLGPLGAALVDNPGVVALIRHHRTLYDDLRDPVALLRGQAGGALAASWPYAGGDAAATQAYSALMEVSQAMVAAEVRHAYRLGRHRALLDVGGGTGAFLQAVAPHAPELRLTLYDLPQVAALARARLAGSGIEVVGGDFLSGALPAGSDLLTLVRVLHDHDDPPALALLAACRAALPPGGRLLVAEPMAGTPGAESAGDGYFGIYLFAMGQGRPRTPARIAALLTQAGFDRPRLMRTRMPLVARVMIASVR